MLYFESMEARILKRKRLLMDLTQEGLAELLEMNSNTISQYENGRQEIPKTVELAVKCLYSEFEQAEAERIAKKIIQ